MKNLAFSYRYLRNLRHSKFRSNLDLTLSGPWLSQWMKFLWDFIFNMSSVCCEYFHQNFLKNLQSHFRPMLVPPTGMAKKLFRIDVVFEESIRLTTWVISLGLQLLYRYMHRSLLYVIGKTASQYLFAFASYSQITKFEKILLYKVRWYSKG